MNKEEALQKINEGEGDFQVFSTSEHEEFLKNYEDSKISPRVSQLLSEYDETIQSVVGSKREKTEKTSDFLKRTLSQLNTEREEYAEKVKTMEEALKDTTGKEAIEQAKRELESVRSKHQSALEEWQAKYDELEKGSHMMKINNELDKGLTGLVFKDASLVPEDVRNVHINVIKGELAKMAEFIDGKMVFKDDKGEIIRDSKLNPLGPKEILKERLKPILNEGRKQPGVGLKDSEPTIEKDKDGKIDVSLSVPDTVKTNVDLTEYLLKSGLKRGTAEYSAAYAKYVVGLTKV